MQKKISLLRYILFFYLIFFKIILSPYFHYEKDSLQQNNRDIVLSYMIPQGFFIDKNTIQITINDIGINPMNIVYSNVGTIYIKNNKEPIESIYNTGIVNINNLESIIREINILYTVFSSLDNTFSNKKETIFFNNNNQGTEYQGAIKNNDLIDSSAHDIPLSNDHHNNKEGRLHEKHTGFFDSILSHMKGYNFIIISFLTFLFGLLMSFTPCIYPMIPITISILGIDKQDFGLRLFAGLLYSLGISLTFSILGLLASSGTILFGELLMHPLFSMITIGVIFVMALQMLGMIDTIFNFSVNFTIPQSLANSKYLPFFYGIFSGTITSPCISPGLLAILSLVSQQNNLFFGWLWLFTFGFGLSLPLLILSLLINSASLFPQSGNWMNQLKEIIGLILIYILNQHLSIHLSYMSASLVTITIFLFFLLFKYKTQYIKGNDTSLENNDTGDKKYGICSFSTLVACLFLLYFTITLYTTYQGRNNNTIEKIIWHDDLEKAFSEALSHKKLLCIDFTADWCSLCQVVNREIFDNRLFIEKTKNRYYFCKIDCTEKDNKKNQLLQKYNIKGFPTFLIINPKTEGVIKQYCGDILDNDMTVLLAEINALSSSIIYE